MNACSLVFGFTSYGLMTLIAIMFLLFFDQLDLSKTFTMTYVFTVIQAGLEYFPLLIMQIHESLVSGRRLCAYFSLPEVQTPAATEQ